MKTPLAEEYGEKTENAAARRAVNGSSHLGGLSSSLPGARGLQPLIPAGPALATSTARLAGSSHHTPVS